MENLNYDFDKIIELCDKKYNTEEIYDTLANGDLLERQVAVLMLEEIRTFDDAELLLSNLTGVDGKLRQAVAYKIFQLMPSYKQFFYNQNFYKTFLNAIVDIDSNVCRLVIDSICYLRDDLNFCQTVCKSLENVINVAFDELAKLSFRTKKYTSNKQYFKIYWALETLIYFYDYMDFSVLKGLMIKCSKVPEYTVREKCAVILKNGFDDNDLQNLYAELKNDQNYYVRNA